MTGAALAQAGFEAIGTTSFGVAAAAGKRDATGHPRQATRELVQRLAHLDASCLGRHGGRVRRRPRRVAELVGELHGIAGINLEDGHGEPALHTRQIAAVKPRTALFVNARADTHWLATETSSDAIARAHATSRPARTACSSPGCRSTTSTPSSGVDVR